MKITKAYKFQLKPRERHMERFEQWAGACRFLWNVLLEYRQMAYHAEELADGQDITEKWLLFKKLDQARRVAYKAEHTEGEGEKAKVMSELPDRMAEVERRHSEDIQSNRAMALAIVDWSTGMAIQRAEAKKAAQAGSGSPVRQKSLAAPFEAERDQILAPWLENGNMKDHRRIMRTAQTPLSVRKQTGLREPQLKPALTALQKQFEWLGDVPSCALQQVVKNQDRAYRRFFDKLGGFPTRKRKHQNSFYLNNTGAVKVFGNNVKIRNMGLVRFFTDRQIEEHLHLGTLNSATVSKSGNKWYISFSIEEEVPDPVTPKGEIGLDRGIQKLIAFSDGRTISPEHALEKNLGRLAKAQRTMARKDKFSNRWRKQVKKIAKIHQDIAHIRNTQLHTVSKQVAREHGLIVVEDLRVQNMSASAKGTAENPGKNVRAKEALNRRILDQGWGELRRQLEYKAQWQGGKVIAVEPQYTSQECSACGFIDAANRDGANFRCGNCGHAEDADVNAAKNILQRGVKELSA